MARMLLLDPWMAGDRDQRDPLRDSHHQLASRAPLAPPRGGSFMRHKTSKVLFAYWDGVRRDRIAPRRFEIDPSRIGGILPHTFILERHDAEHFSYRLAGTRICEIFGRELRGTNFLDGWEPIDRLPLLRMLSTLTRQGSAGVVHMEVAAAAEVPVECEVLLLPLTHTRDTIDRVLGAFSTMETPSWLGYSPVTRKRVLANRLLWPDGDPLPAISRVPDPRVVDPPIVTERASRIVRSEHRRFRVFDGGRTSSDNDV
jgi:hypothetical protein